MPSSIFVDRTNGDVYVSDGEGTGTNRRVVVLDRAGTFLRHGIIDDMDNVHCMTIANDGVVYVSNRQGASIRLYDKTGTLQRTIAVPWTPVTPPKDGVVKESGASAVAIDFSPDPAQRLMFVINQNNLRIEILERASSPRTAAGACTSSGRSRRSAGPAQEIVTPLSTGSTWPVTMRDSSDAR